MKKIVYSSLLTILLVSMGAEAKTQVDPEVALSMLTKQSEHFTQRVVHVAENVYTAVGYHGANTSMIVGTDGIIIIDTLMGPESAANALKAFRQYSDKPVKAIIYTHSHGDHTGGAKVFAGDSQVPIYSMANFAHDHGGDKNLNPLMQKRDIRQFGRALQKSEETNRGIAPAKTIDFDRGAGFLPATIKIAEESYTTTIAGIEIQMHAGAGETDDALFVWLPKEKVLFSGDNFYNAFPNLYAIRGTPYRNILIWSQSAEKMASFKPQFLVGGHTSPIIGEKEATTALQDYSDAIKSVYEQTIKGMNEGKNPNQIAHEVELPDNLKNKPYLIEFYGSVPHAVRAIYAGLIGWFDGNPTTLNPLDARTKANKMAHLAGGVNKLAQQLHVAIEDKEYQWALELADYLNQLPDTDKKIIIASKVKALRGLAAMEYNAPNRNYYLSYANELESGKLSEPWF